MPLLYPTILCDLDSIPCYSQSVLHIPPWLNHATFLGIIISSYSYLLFMTCSYWSSPIQYSHSTPMFFIYSSSLFLSNFLYPNSISSSRFPHIWLIRYTFYFSRLINSSLLSLSWSAIFFLVWFSWIVSNRLLLDFSSMVRYFFFSLVSYNVS